MFGSNDRKIYVSYDTGGTGAVTNRKIDWASVLHMVRYMVGS